MTNAVKFLLDGKVTEVEFGPASGLRPTTTVLQYLRSLPAHRGVKEGCAEGDCGACTVVLGERISDRHIAYSAVDSCLLFLPMLHGRQLVTVENLKHSDGHLHPVQQAMVDHHGSQCGFCTPGIVMSMFALYKNSKQPSRESITSALAGNLCRCTGYRPIIEAAAAACAADGRDQFTVEEASTAGLLSSIPEDSLALHSDDQRFDQPVSLEEALALVRTFPDALVISGATDVALRVTKRFERLSHLIDLSHIKELRSAQSTETGLRLGAGMTITEVRDICRDQYPALYDMLNVFAAEQIRNVATLGGNIGTASPIGDALPVLIAHQAAFELRSSVSTRLVLSAQFVLGYRKTERRPDELITAVLLPPIPDGVKIRSYKISKRRDLDISTISAGFRIALDANHHVRDIVLAYGGMAERTKQAASAETFLMGKPWTRETVVGAQELIDRDFSPISDVRGSAAMRRIAARNLLMKFWTETT